MVEEIWQEQNMYMREACESALKDKHEQSDGRVHRQ